METNEYVDKLVKEQIKVSLGTKDKRIFSGIIKSYNEKGITFIDKFQRTYLFDFEFILYIEEFIDRRNGK